MHFSVWWMKIDFNCAIQTLIFLNKLIWFWRNAIKILLQNTLKCVCVLQLFISTWSHVCAYVMLMPVRVFSPLLFDSAYFQCFSYPIGRFVFSGFLPFAFSNKISRVQRKSFDGFVCVFTAQIGFWHRSLSYVPGLSPKMKVCWFWARWFAHIEQCCHSATIWLWFGNFGMSTSH